MDKLKIILFLMAGVLLFSQCKKDEDEWVHCFDCELSSWVGNFEGLGDYYSDDDSTTTIIDVPTTVLIENTYEKNLKITVSVPGKFSTYFTVNKTDNSYSIEQPGSSKSLMLTLFSKEPKENEYKLAGVVKQYHYEYDTLLYLDHSISFEAIKTQE